MKQDYRQTEAENKKILLEHFPYLTEKSGIYFIVRKDENGIKYAYIGQAKHILTRLAQHMVGYQHIDFSIRKHGLCSEVKDNGNPHGWRMGVFHCSESELDLWEKHFICKYAQHGFQLRNKTAGGQGEGKTQIDEYKPAKGYRDGLAQGRKNASREIAHLFEKHLNVSIKSDKPNKTQEKALAKFYEFLGYHKEGEGNHGEGSTQAVTEQADS